APLVDVLGGRSAAERSIGVALGRAKGHEHLQGWVARAAQGDMPSAEFRAIFHGVDALTARMRSVSNYLNARDAVAGAADLTGVDRERMITRIARRFHAYPGKALRELFQDGDRTRPRFHSAAELDAAIERLVEGNRRSDTGVTR